MKRVGQLTRPMVNLSRRAHLAAYASFQSSFQCYRAIASATMWNQGWATGNEQTREWKLAALALLSSGGVLMMEHETQNKTAQGTENQSKKPLDSLMEEETELQRVEKYLVEKEAKVSGLGYMIPSPGVDF